ncbi:MAG TPA: SDR family NAD(P)-dependent oxidoreductase [Dongiaceae bacterium]|nr:SDR family NAD(P)-dependent oxidoreductase [Dongiaceae bacterium]
MQQQSRPVCVVAGAGPGNGMAYGRRFREGGYRVVLLARDAARLNSLIAQEVDPNHLSARACDLTDGAAIQTIFAEIAAELGPVETLIYNAGNGFPDTLDAFDADRFEQAWRLNQWGLLQCVRQVVPSMRERSGGNILISGATASLRGSPRFLSFAAAKAGQRSVAQSLAKQLMPEGIHVSYLIIDGVIETPMTRQFLASQPKEFFLQADAIADTAFHLTQQPRNAWTFELDLRPFGEKW